VDAECEEAFHKLTTLLTSAPVLAQPNIEKPFDVFCDASGIGLVYVLSLMPRANLENMRSITLLMI